MIFDCKRKEADIMKIKMAAAVLAAAVLVGFCGCSNVDESDSGKLKIVTTIFPQYDFARQIGGDRIELKMLVMPGGESHAYEPSPQDITAVKNCDIFICAGGESDVWTGKILDAIGTEDITVIRMMDCVEVVEEEHVEGMVEGVFETEEDEYDEHVWTSLRNAQLISQEIGEKMMGLDVDNAEFYRENLERYVGRLRELDMEYSEAVEGAENKTLIFGDRFPFRYLFNDYGLEYYAAFPGCSTSTDVSASSVAFLINKVNELSAPVVYYVEFSAGRVADTIAEETEAGTLLFHSCHTVSKEEFEGGVTYEELMRKNLEVLKRGLVV